MRQSLESILDLYDIDLVQLPLNILDRRLIDSDILARLKNRGVEIHVRSVFLQGLLLMPKNQIPDKFVRWKPINPAAPVTNIFIFFEICNVL